MSDNTQEEAQVILCDMCTAEDRKPAKKTCMKCEISMCVQHLQAHLTTPVLLQTHPLTEPMALVGTTKCPQHGKLLEYYCLDDKICVCVSCAIEDQHRVHDMKTFSTAHKELMEKLSAQLKKLQVKTDDKDESLEKWDKSEREKVTNASVRLIDAVTHLRDITLTSVKSSVSARMVPIRTSKSSIQAAQEEKDTFRFLQMYSQVQQDVEKAKAVDLRKGLELGSDRDELIQEIIQKGEDIVKQAGNLWGSLLALVEPENHQELTATASDLEFYTQTSCPAMSFSKDKRKVFYHRWLGPCSVTLHIQSYLLESNFHRWVISLSQDSDWTIGLCDNQFMQNPEAGYVYGLCCKDNKLSSVTTESTRYEREMSEEFGQLQLWYSPTRLSSPLGLKPHGSEAAPRPETVEVIWNREASSLSFYSITGQYQREEIITMKTMSLILQPFVQIQEKSDKNMSQGQWQCSCGTIPLKGSLTFGSAASKRCSCGRLMSELHLTEMLCELK